MSRLILGLNDRRGLWLVRRRRGGLFARSITCDNSIATCDGAAILQVIAARTCDRTSITSDSISISGDAA